MMKEYNSYPFDTNSDDVIDTYIQTCSIEMNCEMGSILAATLANKGVNPLTNDKI